jgi:hypothetical protein
MKQQTIISALSQPFSCPNFSSGNPVGAYTGTLIPLTWFNPVIGSGYPFPSATFALGQVDLAYFQNVTVIAYRIDLPQCVGARAGLGTSLGGGTTGYNNLLSLNYNAGSTVQNQLLSTDILNEWIPINWTPNTDSTPTTGGSLNISNASIVSSTDGVTSVSQGVSLDFRNVQAIYYDTKQYLRVTLQVSYTGIYLQNQNRVISP